LVAAFKGEIGMEQNSKFSKKNVAAFWMITVGVAAVFALVQVGKDEGRRLEQIQNAGGVGNSLPEFGQAGNFAFTNQDNKPVTQADLAGRVWVFNLMFTSCKGPCPLMTHNISRLQKVFSGEPLFRLVSLTTDPEHDTLQVLRDFAASYKANTNQWDFITGTKEQIIAFATQQLKIPAGETVDLHSTKIVLVDQKGIIRGFYDSADSGNMERLRSHIKLLLTSPAT
jgi:protein SCO1/2